MPALAGIEVLTADTGRRPERRRSDPSPWRGLPARDLRPGRSGAEAGTGLSLRRTSGQECPRSRAVWARHARRSRRSAGFEPAGCGFTNPQRWPPAQLESRVRARRDVGSRQQPAQPYFGLRCATTESMVAGYQPTPHGVDRGGRWSGEQKLTKAATSMPARARRSLRWPPLVGNKTTHTQDRPNWDRGHSCPHDHAMPRSTSGRCRRRAGGPWGGPPDCTADAPAAAPRHTVSRR